MWGTFPLWGKTNKNIKIWNSRCTGQDQASCLGVGRGAHYPILVTVQNPRLIRCIYWEAHAGNLNSFILSCNRPREWLLLEQDWMGKKRKSRTLRA